MINVWTVDHPELYCFDKEYQNNSKIKRTRNIKKNN